MSIESIHLTAYGTAQSPGDTVPSMKSIILKKKAELTENTPDLSYVKEADFDLQHNQKI